MRPFCGFWNMLCHSSMMQWHLLDGAYLEHGLKYIRALCKQEAVCRQLDIPKPQRDVWLW